MVTREEALRELQGLELLDALQAQDQPAPRTALQTTEDVARSVVEGATLGFAEELAAGAGTVLRGGTFEENLAIQRARQEEIPGGIRIGGNIVGGVATGAGIARLFPAAFSTLPRAAVASAVEGGIAGVGFGDTPEERRRGAVTGILTGGVLGATLPKTFEGLARAWALGSTRFGSATRTAGNIILKQFRDGDIGLNQAKARLTKLGREAVLADIPELRGLAERIAQSGGIGARRAQRILNARAKRAGGRIVDAAGDILGNRRMFQETVEELVEERAALAGPLYDEAYAKVIGLPDELQNAAGRLAKLVPAAIQRAERSLAAELGADLTETSVANIARGGQISFNRTPSVQYWDLVKREVDDLIGNAVRAGQNNRARQLGSIREQIVKSLDEQTDGAYAAARQAFANPIKLQEALEAGRGFVRGDADKIISDIGKMTNGEKEMYRLGIVKGVQDITETRSLTSDQTRRIFDTERNNRIFREIFSNERDLRRFKRVILREREFTETNRILGGSQTFRRLTQAQTDRDAAGAAADILTQGQESLVRRIVGGVADAVRAQDSPAVRAELGRALFAQGEGVQAGLGLAAAREAAAGRAVAAGRPLGAGVALGGATAGAQTRNR